MQSIKGKSEIETRIGEIQCGWAPPSKKGIENNNSYGIDKKRKRKKIDLFIHFTYIQKNLPSIQTEPRQACRTSVLTI